MGCKISVILPVFNVEKYLKTCLESLLMQNMNNFEVIAINDGSTDNSLEILMDYKKKIKNMIVINKQNSGLSDTRNLGIKNSKGKYILFLDSDDMLEGNTLESLYNLAFDNSLDLVVYDGVRIDEFTGKVDNKKYDRRKIFFKEILEKEDFFKGNIKKGMLHSPFHFYSAKFIKENNLEYKNDLLHEDELFSMNTYQYIEKVGYCNKQLYIRRYRKNSIMSGNLYQNINSLNSYIYILSEFSKLKELNKDNKEFLRMVNSRQNLIGNNLIRYEKVSIKEFMKYKNEYKFKINIPRLLANYIIFRLLKGVKKNK